VFPVIKADALHLFLTQRKAHRLDEVQLGASGETCTARVSGVPVSFGMHECDVRCQDCWPPRRHYSVTFGEDRSNRDPVYRRRLTCRHTPLPIPSRLSLSSVALEKLIIAFERQRF
jgi:hypothetical protein